MALVVATGIKPLYQGSFLPETSFVAAVAVASSNEAWENAAILAEGLGLCTRVSKPAFRNSFTVQREHRINQAILIAR